MSITRSSSRKKKAETREARIEYLSHKRETRRATQTERWKTLMRIWRSSRLGRTLIDTLSRILL